MTRGCWTTWSLCLMMIPSRWHRVNPPVGHREWKGKGFFGAPENGERNIQLKDLNCPDRRFFHRKVTEVIHFVLQFFFGDELSLISLTKRSKTANHGIFGQKGLFVAFLRYSVWNWVLGQASWRGSYSEDWSEEFLYHTLTLPLQSLFSFKRILPEAYEILLQLGKISNCWACVALHFFQLFPPIASSLLKNLVTELVFFETQKEWREAQNKTNN